MPTFNMDLVKFKNVYIAPYQDGQI